MIIRIRFHGRGGHGMKTASRIVGTAAFLQGYVCQDSPVYGAERRGASVTAFTRIADGPIHERGTIPSPDLICIADDSLLADPAAGVLGGQAAASAVFVNTVRPAELVAEYHITPPIHSYDLTGRTCQILGRAVALSAGMAGAAARLSGLIEREILQQAVREEFQQLHLSAEEIDHNLQLALEVYDALSAASISRQELASSAALAAIDYHEPHTSAPTVLQVGNAEAIRTGAWRVERPLIDLDRCTRCGLCFVECPDGAITHDAHGFPVIDYDHCKGCMICRQICPITAIHVEKETRAW